MALADRHFVLLDDAHTGRGTLLTDLVDVIEVDLHGLDDALADGWDHQLHCFVWLPYDVGEAHHGLRPSGTGAVYRFAQRAEVDSASWLRTNSAEPSGVIAPMPAWGEHEFAAGVSAVQEAIRRGDSYQVNLTFPVEAGWYGEPLDLYRRLRLRQPTSYAVAAHLPPPAPRWTLSLSPELFVRITPQGQLICQPMKGTADVRSVRDPRMLAADPKNRAENVMIVDLLRNDLGQVAVPGTVVVTALFDVDQVGELWQMTSTVEATARPRTTPGALMAAAFPCGSITGAPKSSSMALIRELEDAPRRGYTGSMGLLERADTPFGWSGCLNVAIRTIEIDEETLRVGVGAGITIGSDPHEEYRECLSKAAFLTALPPEFGLIETMYVHEGKAPRLTWHAARLARSAAELGFPTIDAATALREAVLHAPSTGSHRVRLELSPDGSTTVSHSPLAPLAQGGDTVTLLIDPVPWRVDALSRYKTTHRNHLDHAWRQAAALGAFDTIGTDSSGYVLEGGRSTVFALLDGVWRTPPLSRNILASVARAEILDQGTLFGRPVEERDVHVDELRTASRLIAANAVVGALPAKIGCATGAGA